MTNVLMVTTTVRMFDGVHGNTSNSWPVSLLGVSSVVGAVGSEERFVSSLATGDDANHSSATSKDRLTDTRWESDTGLLAILGVTDHDGGGTRGTGKSATVSELGLNIGDNGTLWHLVDREDITDSEGGFGAAIDELAGVHAFNSNEILLVLLEFVLVSEYDLSERGATAGIMQNILDNTLDVSFTLSEVNGSESSG